MSLHPALAVLLEEGLLPDASGAGSADAEGVRTEFIDVPMPGGHSRLAIHSPAETAGGETIIWFDDNLPGLLGPGHGGDGGRLCASAGRRVIAGSIGTAPRHKDLLPLRDSAALVRWLAENRAAVSLGDRVCLGGRGSGAGLAASACELARQVFGKNLVAAILVCPLLDYELSAPSFETMAEGYGLDYEALAAWVETVVPDDSRRSAPDLSPFHRQSFAHMPPTFVASAEFDMLRDDAEAFATLLQDEGIAVESMVFPGMIHDFMSLGAYVPEADDLFGAIRAFLDRQAS